jgi:aminoglycoside phosphotransferase (APT) family kinase protein
VGVAGSGPRGPDHRTFIAERFPQVGRIRTFERIEGGWDCATFVVNDEWIVQFPVLPGAAEALRKQVRMLPRLAPEVSAAIPEPELVSEDPICMGYRRIDGVPMTDAGEGGIWPERLGRFLADLHLVPPEWVGLRARTPEQVRARLAEFLPEVRSRLFRLLDPTHRRGLEREVERFLGDDRNWRFAVCVTHGDLGPAHVLVAPSGDLSGVIDWGDAEVGDPVWDFAWMLYAMPAVGERALAAYGGPPDGRFRHRSRFAYLQMPWHEVLYGLDTDQPAVVASGLEGTRARLREIGGDA